MNEEISNWLETLDTASKASNYRININKINSQKLKIIIFYGKGHPSEESKTDNEDSFSIATSFVCACHLPCDPCSRKL